jgi:hypothetical protein
MCINIFKDILINSDRNLSTIPGYLRKVVKFVTKFKIIFNYKSP